MAIGSAWPVDWGPASLPAEESSERWETASVHLQDRLQLHRDIAEVGARRRVHLPARLQQEPPLVLAPAWHLRRPEANVNPGQLHIESRTAMR